MPAKVLMNFFAILYISFSATGFAYSAIIYVDSASAGNLKNGSLRNPFASLQEAVDAAAINDTVKVAMGTYPGNVMIAAKNLTLIGGYLSSVSVKDGKNRKSYFTIRDYRRYVSTVDGSISMINSTGKVDGLRVINGNPGIRVAGNSGVSLVNCTLEHCGAPHIKQRGGGISISGPTLKKTLVANCVMRNNFSGRGAGIFTSDSTEVTIQDCLVENNTGYDNHGGGVCVTGNARILRNTIRGNIIGAGEGFQTSYGSGFISQGTHTLVYSAFNVIYDNLAKTPGGAAASFYDEGTTAVVENDIIFKNRNESARVSGLQFDGGGDYNGFSRTRAIVRNCTVADNMNAGVWVEDLADVQFENCIIWNNGDNQDFRVKDSTSSTISVDYCLSGMDPASIKRLQSAKGNIVGRDPLFADPAKGDYHLKSARGRWNPFTSTWITDKASSPAIDAGNPSSSFAKEPFPNGGRIDLGAFGNTVQASKSVRMKK